MKFRTDFLVLPALVHAVEKGWLTLDEALSATNDPTGWTDENQRLEQHLHLNALLYDRGLLSPQDWQALQPTILQALDNQQIWVSHRYETLRLLLFRHLDITPTLLEKLITYSFLYHGRNHLTRLQPHLTDDLRCYLWDYVQQLQPVNKRTDKLSMIVPFIPDDLVSSAFQSIMAMPPMPYFDPYPAMIAPLIHRLNETEFQQALAYMRQFKKMRINRGIEALLREVLTRLSPDARAAELDNLWAWAAEQTLYFQDILEGIVPFLHQDHLAIALEHCLQHEAGEMHCRYLLTLFPSLEKAERQFFTPHILKQIPLIHANTSDTIDDEHRWWLLDKLAPYLPTYDPDLTSAYELVKQCIQSPRERSYALGRLAEFASEPLRQQLIEEALQAALPSTIANHIYAVGDQSGLIRLLPMLDERLFEQAFAAMMTPPESQPIYQDHANPYLLEQARALGTMFPRLNEEQIRRILTRMQEVEEGA